MKYLHYYIVAIEYGDSGDKLRALLKEISADINPDDVIVLAEAGSKMYGLSTPSSDTDYIIVYRNRTEDIISSTSNLKVSLLTELSSLFEHHQKCRIHFEYIYYSSSKKLSHIYIR